MVTIVFRMIIKNKKETEFVKMVDLLTETTQKEDKGLIFYCFYQGITLKNEYILYEKWRDKKSLNDHLARLRKLLGPAKPGNILSDKLNNYFAKTEDVYYQDSGIKK